MDKRLHESTMHCFVPLILFLYSQIKRVIVTLHDLMNHIKEDQESRVKVEEPLSIEIFNVKHNPD